MARRFGSAMIPNAVSMFYIYTQKHIRVKGYKQENVAESSDQTNRDFRDLVALTGIEPVFQP